MLEERKIEEALLGIYFWKALNPLSYPENRTEHPLSPFSYSTDSELQPSKTKMGYFIKIKDNQK